MSSTSFSSEFAQNRTAYEQLKEEIRRAAPDDYAAIAQGRLITVAPTFDEAMAAVRQLQPPPQHFLVFPADEEPAFDVIDDFWQGR